MSTSAAASHGQTSLDDEADKRLYSKIAWRIMPLLMVAYIISYLDRINIGFAALQMKDALHFSAEAFSFAAGIMFVGYFLFEVPSNVLLERIGARKTFVRIMVLWGLTAAATMFVTSHTQFYILRFFLGVFEAGFFPGVILYLTFWFPAERRGRMVALFGSAAVIGGIIAGPLSGGTLKYMDGIGGLAGWQWLYVTQGLPAVVLGILIFVFLKDKPTPGGWLTVEDCDRIKRDLEATAPAVGHVSHRHKFRSLLRNPMVWWLAAADFLVLGANYTMVFWVPTLIKSWGISDPLKIGVYAALPSIVGVVGMLVMGRSSDRWLERRWHFMVACIVTAVGLFATTLTLGQLTPSLIALCFAAAGMAATVPMLTTVISEYLPQEIAAPGIALITSTGILGAAVSPIVTGMVTARTGSNVYSMYLVMALFIVAGLLILAVVPRRRDVAPA